MNEDKEAAIIIMEKNHEYMVKVLEAHHLHNCLKKLQENRTLFYKLFHKTEEKKRGIKK